MPHKQFNATKTNEIGGKYWNRGAYAQKYEPLVFLQLQWGCTFSKLRRTPLRIGLRLTCASWWCRCAPSPTCRGWGRRSRRLACCILERDSVMWLPDHPPLWNDDEPAQLMCWNDFQLLRRPEAEEKETNFKIKGKEALLSKESESSRCLQPNLSVRGGVDPVMIDPSLIAKRDGELARAALTLPH